MSTFEDEYGHFYQLATERHWPEVIDAGQALATRWSSEHALDSSQKRMLAEAMWLRAWALATSSGQSQANGIRAFEALDDLLCWLRDQDDSDLRPLLARRLIDKARWLHGYDGTFESIEQSVAVLETVTDLKVVRDVVAVMLGDVMLWLGGSSPEDKQRIDDAAAIAYERGVALAGPAETGLSDAAVRRNEAAVRAFDRLAALLSEDSTKAGEELRAQTLIVSRLPLGLLGRAAESEATRDEVVALGSAGIAAVDRLLNDAERRVEASSDGGFPQAIVVFFAMNKAEILFAAGRSGEAVATLDSVITRLAERTDRVPGEVQRLQDLRYTIANWSEQFDSES